MISTDHLAASLARALGLEPGSTLEALRPLAGGDSQQALRCRLGDRDWFIKFAPRADRPMLEREAEGLNALAATNTLAVPSPLLCDADERHAHAFTFEWWSRK